MLGSQPDNQRLGKDLWHGGRVMPPIEERYGTANRAAETTARRIAKSLWRALGCRSDGGYTAPVCVALQSDRLEAVIDVAVSLLQQDKPKESVLVLQGQRNKL